LLVTFDSSDIKPNLNDIILVDPTRDYTRYTLKLDECNTKDYFFFSGQIIYVEGILKQHLDIHATKIIFGFPLVQYELTESLVKPYYSEVILYY